MLLFRCSPSIPTLNSPPGICSWKVLPGQIPGSLGQRHPQGFIPRGGIQGQQRWISLILRDSAEWQRCPEVPPAHKRLWQSPQGPQGKGWNEATKALLTCPAQGAAMLGEPGPSCCSSALQIPNPRPWGCSALSQACLAHMALGVTDAPGPRGLFGSCSSSSAMVGGALEPKKSPFPPLPSGTRAGASTNSPLARPSQPLASSCGTAHPSPAVPCSGVAGQGQHPPSAHPRT